MCNSGLPKEIEDNMCSMIKIKTTEEDCTVRNMDCIVRERGLQMQFSMALKIFLQLLQRYEEKANEIIA